MRDVQLRCKLFFVFLFLYPQIFDFMMLNTYKFRRKQTNKQTKKGHLRANIHLEDTELQS